MKNTTIEKLKKILTQYKEKKLSLKEVLEYITEFPYQKLKESVIDIHRELRKGIPEVVFCEHKSLEQLTTILTELYKRHNFVLGTRLAPEIYTAIKFQLPKNHKYYNKAKIIYIGKPVRERKGGVLVVSAGSCDVPVAEEAAVTCELLGNRVYRIYDIGVAGLHRINEIFFYLKKVSVVIVVAGMDGVLPSVIGGIVDVPVIGVPTSIGYGTNFQGVAPMLTMLNSCAPGVVVVNINNGFGAGYVASLINKKK